MHDEQEDPTDEQRYVQYLAARLVDYRRSAPESTAVEEDLRQQVHALQELLRSPRHRAATLAGDALQRVPLVKPLTAWLTGRFLNRSHGRR
jgi:hypothetical protein